jgi:hypothetical protein
LRPTHTNNDLLNLIHLLFIELQNKLYYFKNYKENDDCTC